jgi:hypothetical protein
MSNVKTPIKPPPLRPLKQPPANKPLQPVQPMATKPPMRSLAGRTVGDLGKTTQAGKPERDYLLLDRSGSMSDKWKDALGAINTYVRTLGSRLNTRILLATFDDVYEVVRRDQHPLQWRAITSEEVQPRGMTALNDAIGLLVAQAKADNPEKASIVIMTDGGENSSKELTDEQAKALLDECRARGWQVIMLGMGYDNSELAAQYGTDPNQTIAAGTEALTVTMQKAAEKRATYSQTGQRIMFSGSEKADAGRKLLR